MSIVAAPARAHATGAYDRIFYTSIAVAMALTVFIGFARTYYLRAYFGATDTVTGASGLTPLVVVHGLVFTAWVVLFVVQTMLVAARRVALHRRLGIAGVALAALMVVVGMSTAIAGARRGAAPPGIDALTFLVVPFFDMVLFAGFVSAAVYTRRNREAHKRLMLLAYVSIIVAAVARIPGVEAVHQLAFFWFSFLFVVAGAVYDLASRGRIHRAYLWGGGIFAASVPLRFAITGTDAWRWFAGLLIG